MTPAAPDKPADAAPLRLPPGLARRVAIAVALTLPAAAALIAGVLVLSNAADAWRGFIPASVVAAIAAALSLVPLTMISKFKTPEAVMGLFMAAGGVRMVASVGLGLVAVYVGRFPQSPTMLLIAAFYFCVLAVEAGVLGRALWNAPANV